MQTIEHTFEAPPEYQMRRIRLSNEDPLTFIPHGDRLLVEVLELDETTESGIFLARLDENAKEAEVGWVPGVVVNVGNGHRLDTPDQAVPMQTTAKKLDPAMGLVALDDETGHGVVMVQSTVPMPFVREQVIMLAKYAGSSILMQGRPYKIITQSHVLGRFPKLRLPVGNDEEPGA